MKIAITGHTAGIGKSFASLLSSKGHEIIGISRRDGENIRRIEHTASIIESCDMFINNAQSMFAQTELFYEVWKRWKGQKKYIWNISTAMTQLPVNTTPDNHDDIDMSIYRTQKLSLEEASRQLSFKSRWPVVSIIRPGSVATSDSNNENKHLPDEWVKCIVDIFNVHNNIHISEISLSHSDPKNKIIL